MDNCYYSTAEATDAITVCHMNTEIPLVLGLSGDLSKLPASSGISLAGQWH